MATGPNQILIKRSDVVSNEPSGLSYGEPAVNTADGKIFIAQQTNGTPSGDLWEFHGTTNGGVVTSVNGETGDVTVVGSTTADPSYLRVRMGDSVLNGGASAQDFDSASYVVMKFDTEEDHDGSDISADYTLHKFTAKSAGLYRLTCNATFTCSVIRITPSVSFNLNGSILLGQAFGYIRVASGQDENACNLTRVVYMDVDDYIEVCAHDSTTISGAVTATQAIFEMEKIAVGPMGATGPTGADGAAGGVSSFNGGTGDVEGVASFNGATGAVEGVSEFAGFTGAVAEGVTTNQILFHNGLGITGSGNFTFDGTDVILGGVGHFDGGMDGPHQKKIKADEALAAGDPVYITGNVGASDRVTVAKADASDSAKMPAAGIVKTAFSTNQEGYMTIGGSIYQFDTSGYTANDQLYVSPGGGLTLERPSSASDLVQKVVRVGRVSATTGTIIVSGANRANDVPNLLHVRAGISMDAGGITFSDGTFQSTAASSAEAGAGITVNGSTVGIDPDATILVSGVSCSGGITVGNMFIGTVGSAERLASIADTDDFVNFAANKFEVYQDNQRMIKADTSKVYIGTSSTNKDLNVFGVMKASDLVHAEAGISIDAGGITFADGTFQSTAASGSGLDTSQPLTLTGGDTTTAALSIENDDTGTNAAPIIELCRVPSDGGTGTDGDYLGQIKFKGESDTGTTRVYAKITGKIGTATNGDEDGVVEHMVQADGLSDIIFRTNKNGIALTDGKALIFEGDTNNTSETTLYVADPSSDQTITLPDDTGTVALTKDVVTSVNGSTGDVTVSAGGGGPTMSIGFILDGNGSPLGTGDKIDALRQIPYDAYVLSTSAFVQAGVSGTDKTIAFNINKTSTLSNSITGTPLELGNTASADQSGFTFDGIAGGIYFRELANNGNSAGSTLNAKEWIYPEITGNSGDIDKIQIFMTIQPL